MTFVLGLFATIITAMFVATFTSSVIAANREAADIESRHRLSIF
jgi:hypothetical protein